MEIWEPLPSHWGIEGEVGIWLNSNSQLPPPKAQNRNVKQPSKEEIGKFAADSMCDGQVIFDFPI